MCQSPLSENICGQSRLFENICQSRLPEDIYGQSGPLRVEVPGPVSSQRDSRFPQPRHQVSVRTVYDHLPSKCPELRAAIVFMSSINVFSLFVSFCFLRNLVTPIPRSFSSSSSSSSCLLYSVASSRAALNCHPSCSIFAWNLSATLSAATFAASSVAVLMQICCILAVIQEPCCLDYGGNFCNGSSPRKASRWM